MALVASNTVKEFDPKTFLKSIHCDSDASTKWKFNGMVTPDHLKNMGATPLNRP